MNWLKSVLLKMFRGMIETFLNEALNKALTEMEKELEDNFTPEQQETLKSGAFLLKQRLHLVIRENLGG